MLFKYYTFMIEHILSCPTQQHCKRKIGKENSIKFTTGSFMVKYCYLAECCLQNKSTRFERLFIYIHIKYPKELFVIHLANEFNMHVYQVAKVLPVFGGKLPTLGNLSIFCLPSFCVYSKECSYVTFLTYCCRVFCLSVTLIELKL